MIDVWNNMPGVHNRMQRQHVVSTVARWPLEPRLAPRLAGGSLTDHLTVKLPHKDKLLGRKFLSIGVRKRCPENQQEPGELGLVCVADADPDGVEFAVLKALAALPVFGCMHTASVATAAVDQANVSEELHAANAERLSATSACLVPQERRLEHLENNINILSKSMQ